MCQERDAHFQINRTLTLIKINCFRKENFVRLSFIHLCSKFYKATFKIINSAINYVKSIKSVLAHANDIF